MAKKSVCGDCGRELQEVRPGKRQCDFCEDTDWTTWKARWLELNRGLASPKRPDTGDCPGTQYPRYRPGAMVALAPDLDARVLRVIWDGHGFTYTVAWWHNGDRKVAEVSELEIKGKGT